MNTALVLATFAVAAASMAVWVEVRFPSLGPDSLRGALIHVGVSIAAGRLLVPFATHLLGDASRPIRVLLVAGIAFPVLVYTFLAAVWIVKIWRDAFRRFSH